MAWKHCDEKREKKSTLLVCELVRVPVHPVLRGQRHFVEVAAVLAALARLDEHGRPPEALAVRAHKGHGHGARASRQTTAPAIRARAAVVGPVAADAGALAVGQVGGRGRLLRLGALPASLWETGSENSPSLLSKVIVSTYPIIL